MLGIQILRANVWHRRCQVTSLAFRYPALYFLRRLRDGAPAELRAGNWLFGINRPALVSLSDKDLGAGEQGANLGWVRDQLQMANLDIEELRVELLCMPRFLGFVFNPVSFWLCRNSLGDLQAVIAEVHNTFGDRHRYVCFHEDGRAIQSGDELFATKDFHVSPFFSRDGRYRFRFDLREGSLGIEIDYFDCNGQLRLQTGLGGELFAFSSTCLVRELLRAPLVSLGSSIQIGWQALRLRWRKVRWHHRPQPLEPTVSLASDRALNSTGETSHV